MFWPQWVLKGYRINAEMINEEVTNDNVEEVEEEKKQRRRKLTATRCRSGRLTPRVQLASRYVGLGRMGVCAGSGCRRAMEPSTTTKSRASTTYQLCHHHPNSLSPG